MTLRELQSTPRQPAGRGNLSRPGLLAAALVHAGLGYALVTGLDIAEIFTPPPPPPLIVSNVPRVQPPEPQPEPTRDAVTPTTRAPDLPDPAPPTPLPPAKGTVTLTLPIPGPIGPLSNADDLIVIDPPHPPRLPVAETLTPARPARGNIISEDDYPVASRRIGEEGTVEARFTVSLGGRAQGCEVVVSSGFPRLDAATCEKIERRFRFTPARQGDKAIEEVRTQKVRWALQG